jgi:hypothetical protein
MTIEVQTPQPDEEIVEDLDELSEVLPETFSITSYGADYPVDGLIKRLQQGDIIVPLFSKAPEEGQTTVGFQQMCRSDTLLYSRLPHAVTVRRAGSLPAASFRFHLAVDTLAVRLAVPAIRVRRGLSPPSHPGITTMTGTAPVKALRAMPGAPKKKAG